VAGTLPAVTVDPAETSTVVIGSFIEVVARALDNGAPVCAEPLERTLVFDKVVATWMFDDASVIPVTLVACVAVEALFSRLVTRAPVIGDSVCSEFLELRLFSGTKQVENVEDPFITVFELL